MLNVEMDAHTAMLRLTSMADKTRSAVMREAQSIAVDLQARVKGAVSGEVLNVRTGFLRSHILQAVEGSADGVIGQVFTSGVKYAAIHEYGGTINHPGGTAYLAIDGIVRFISNSNPLSATARRTAAHPIPIPERSFMRRSLDQMRSEIIERMKGAVEKSAR